MNKAIKVTVAGSILNVLLSIIKVLFGFLGNSMGLIADGFHSLSDLVTDIVVIVGIFIGRKPPDLEHQYGHKKLENFAEIVMGLILIGVAVKIGYDSVILFFNSDRYTPEIYTVVIAFISVVGKEVLFHVTKKTADSEKSKVVLANAWHHRSDALTSLAILVSLILSRFFRNLYFLDSIMGFAISVIIVVIGIKIISKSVLHLSDIAPGKEYYEKVKSLVNDYTGVINSHHLRMRYIGETVFIETHIEVEPDITVKDGHDISTGVKEMLMNWDENICDVLIHIEPAGDHIINQDDLNFD